MMKKLITIIFLLVAVNIYGLTIASSPNNPHYLNFSTANQELYVNKYIFINKIDSDVIIYKGVCLRIDSMGITFKDTSGADVKIMTIPMYRIKNYYIREK